MGYGVNGMVIHVASEQSMPASVVLPSNIIKMSIVSIVIMISVIMVTLRVVHVVLRVVHVVCVYGAEVWSAAGTWPSAAGRRLVGGLCLV